MTRNILSLVSVLGLGVVNIIVYLNYYIPINHSIKYCDKGVLLRVATFYGYISIVSIKNEIDNRSMERNIILHQYKTKC